METVNQDPELRKRVTIFSVCSESLPAPELPPTRRGRFQPTSEFRIGPGSAESPAILVVEDQRESVYVGEDAQGNRLYDFRPILAMKLARDLVNEWRDLIPNSVQGRRIGVAIAEGDMPTKEEIETAVKEQAAFDTELVKEARQHHADGHSHLIKKKHRTAAARLKLMAEPWIHETMSPGDRENCPACGGIIPAGKYVCMICGTKIRQLPKELAALNSAPVTPHLPGNRPAA